MSSSDHAILDLGEDELQFTNTDYKSGGESRSSTLGEFPASPGLVGDTEQLVGEEAGPSQWRTGSFWTLAFYQQFFDVDTTDVKVGLHISQLLTFKLDGRSKKSQMNIVSFPLHHPF